MGIKISRKVVAFDTWQNDIIIHPGYSLYIHYRDGEWNINPGKHGSKKYGPEGSEIVAQNDGYPMLGEREGCLIGRLIYDTKIKNEGIRFEYPELNGESNQKESILFTIGREGLLIPKSDYPKKLSLRCNDIDNGVFDNEGELLLDIEIW